MPAGQLRAAGWKAVTTGYPDPNIMITILGICKFGARIGYEGDRNAPRIYPNLKTAADDPHLVTSNIESELEKGRLEEYPDRGNLPDHYTASPLGLMDKADGSKHRIHHLSYPPNDATSINTGIPESYGTITYSSVNNAIEAIQQYGKDCQLVKRDFESAFRHIPVSPLDTPLLGFQWGDKLYAERFLPFGLRTAPYIFNLFAEVFHGSLEEQFTKVERSASVIHYLDDFLIVLPPAEDMTSYTSIFSNLCEQVGLSIKTAKNEQGRIATFAGVELDTKLMVVRLPSKKLEKARAMVREVAVMTSVTLLDLQKITGYLNFVTIVVPLGRAFLRHLYNMELYFPQGSKDRRRRISSEAHKDLAWWSQILSESPERSIRTRDRNIIRTWTDAASKKGLGGYFLQEGETIPQPGAAFSIRLPRHLGRTKEHINTQEMRAVEQALLYWGKSWRGKKVIMYIDNRAVAYADENRTIRGASMTVLRRCLLLAAEHDLDLETRWIPTQENTLADALSRFNYEKIANLAPQLSHPVCDLRSRRFLT